MTPPYRWTDQGTWDSGARTTDPLPAGVLNAEWRDDLEYLRKRPRLDVYRSSSQELPSDLAPSGFNAWVVFDKIASDLWEMTVPSQRFAGIPVGAWYEIPQSGLWRFSYQHITSPPEGATLTGVVMGFIHADVSAQVYTSPGIVLEPGLVGEKAARIVSDWECGVGDVIWAIAILVSSREPWAPRLTAHLVAGE